MEDSEAFGQLATVPFARVLFLPLFRSVKLRVWYVSRSYSGNGERWPDELYLLGECGTRAFGLSCLIQWKLGIGALRGSLGRGGRIFHWESGFNGLSGTIH